MEAQAGNEYGFPHKDLPISLWACLITAKGTAKKGVQAWHGNSQNSLQLENFYTQVFRLVGVLFVIFSTLGIFGVIK
jgi:hypothetical protein